MSKKLVSIIRWLSISIWLVIAITCLAYFLYDPSKFTASSISDLLLRFENGIILIYFALSVLRGFTLLPSTPLVVAGTLIFSSQPFLVLAISLIGIILSSTMIYYFSDLLGFTDYFKRKKPQTVERIKRKLEHPLGSVFVALWAFFPFVPTDLVCYVAGITRMNFAKFIVSIAIGEAILCSAYIFGGKSLVDGLLG